MVRYYDLTIWQSVLVLVAPATAGALAEAAVAGLLAGGRLVWAGGAISATSMVLGYIER